MKNLILLLMLVLITASANAECSQACGRGQAYYAAEQQYQNAKALNKAELIGHWEEIGFTRLSFPDVNKSRPQAIFYSHIWVPGEPGLAAFGLLDISWSGNTGFLDDSPSLVGFGHSAYGVLGFDQGSVCWRMDGVSYSKISVCKAVRDGRIICKSELYDTYQGSIGSLDSREYFVMHRTSTTPSVKKP